MKTLIIKTLDNSKGVHPQAGNANIRLLAQGDNTGTIDIIISQYPNATTPVKILGGVFIVEGLEQTTATISGASLNLKIKLSGNEAFIAINTAVNYTFRELNFQTQTVNSPIIDYSYPVGSKMYSIAEMFNGNKIFNRSVRGLQINNASISPMSQMSNAFANAYAFNQPVNHIDTSFVRIFYGVFSNAYVFNQSISNWNTSNAVQMNGMFGNAYAFNQPVAHLDVSKCTNLDGMFNGAMNFNQDISGWNYNLNVSLIDTLTNTAISVSNYSKFLQKLAQKDWTGRTAQKLMYARNLKYNAEGAIARATLVSGGWTILDSGQA